MKLGDWTSRTIFKQVHSRNLVYNTCWEDPRLDREALRIGPKDRIMVITSGGCNALDYVLTGPQAVHAVDVNGKQNALLELKMAGIRRLDFETYFAIFGRGRFADFPSAYHDALRADLTPMSRKFWDRRVDFFSGRHRRGSFYFHGTSGAFAYLVNVYINRVAKIRNAVDDILHCQSLDEQREIYDGRIRPDFWNRFLRWAVGRDAALAMLGVPRAQRRQIDGRYDGGIVRFIEDCIEAVFAKLPLADNYFWRVYLTGEYTRECAPEYLRPENFAALKAGLVDRIHVHTSTVEQFLRGYDGTISRFVLLDHMDWLADHLRPALESEWQAIVDKAAANARIIWRSGGATVDFVDPIQVRIENSICRMSDLLHYERPLAARLHERDRVHTYGNFYIAQLAAA